MLEGCWPSGNGSLLKIMHLLPHLQHAIGTNLIPLRYSQLSLSFAVLAFMFKLYRLPRRWATSIMIECMPGVACGQGF